MGKIYPNLKYLYITTNKIDNDDINIITEFLKVMPRLEKLNLTVTEFIIDDYFFNGTSELDVNDAFLNKVIEYSKNLKVNL